MEKAEKMISGMSVVIIIVGIVLGDFVGGLIGASTSSLHGGPTLARVGRGGIVVRNWVHLVAEAMGLDASDAYLGWRTGGAPDLEAIERGLKVMDTTALSLCMDNRLPILVFELAGDNIRRVAAGERVGTIISTP